MRTRTDTIVFRLGFTLAVLVLGAFLGLIGATVVLVGGPAGWAVGVVLGLVVAQVTRRPCGALIGRLVASV